MHPAKLRAKAILSRLQGVENPVVAEIGVFVGALSQQLLAARPDLTLYMVDCWGENQAEHYKDTNDFHANASTEQQRGWEAQTRNMAKEYGDRAVICKGLSAEVSQQFADNFFDLVFIDADHSYEGCLEDIKAWESKVKKGGWMSGHDYENNEADFKFGVTEAVDEWLPKNKELLLDLNYTWFVKL